MNVKSLEEIYIKSSSWIVRHRPLYLQMLTKEFIDPIMSSSSAPVYADNVVNQVMVATSVGSLSNTLKNGISRDAREVLLVSFLSNGQDPLTALDVRFHTLGILYIL